MRLPHACMHAHERMRTWRVCGAVRCGVGIGGGTPHKPAILGGGGHVLHESTACARYLQARHGVPLSAMLKEVSSYDTVRGWQGRAGQGHRMPPRCNIRRRYAALVALCLAPLALPCLCHLFRVLYMCPSLT